LYWKFCNCALIINFQFLTYRNPTPAITDLTPTKWIPLKHGDVYDYLNIDIEPRMESIHKGKQRYDWKNIKHKL